MQRLEVSGAVRLIYRSLGVKVLRVLFQPFYSRLVSSIYYDFIRLNFTLHFVALSVLKMFIATRTVFT